MEEPLFEIGATGIDTSRIVDEIQATVARKTERNIYTDPRVARAERSNLMNLKDDEAFLAFYMECLREAVFVDIGDFPIHERRSRFSRMFVMVKGLIWTALKFYTYRLWSQQNQVNGLLLSAVDAIENRNRARILELQERVARLESEQSRPPPR